MNRSSFAIFVTTFLVLTFAFSFSATSAAQEPSAVGDLSFQADIYGNTNLETLRYHQGLDFQDYGGFGTNAPIFRAGLTSDDAIAYAVSASNPNAFSLDLTKLTPEGRTSITVDISNADYTAGTVTMPAANELHFTWQVEQPEIHFNLHRHVTLADTPGVAADYVISETFTVENLGPAFTLDSFIEYLHMDDAAAARDFDCDGIPETLVATNRKSSNDYPAFGKLYRQEQNLHTQMTLHGNYATVRHFVYRSVDYDDERPFLTANYVSSTEKDAAKAEQQVATDVNMLLDEANTDVDIWAVRSYRTDDRGGVFVNGRMVAGSRYNTYPDSGWVDVCNYLSDEDDTYISFASWDLGIGSCCATWDFALKHNGTLEWQPDVNSGSTKLGITYSQILSVSQGGEVTPYEQPPPSTSLPGNWELTVQANGGFAFVLLDNQPIAGSTNATAQTLNISELLGEEENTLHLNTWNDGSGIHDWSFVLRRDGEVVWEASSEVENEPRGAAYYNRIVIGAEGNVVDPLDVPLFLQDSEPWGNYFYDGHTAEEATPGNRNDMDELGCYTTSGAMIINYLAAEVGVAHRTDPGLLNAAAQGSGGYSGTSFVPDFVNTYGEQHNIPIYFHGYLWGRNPANDQRIADYLAAGQPVILKIPAQPNTPSGHFVAATGVTETAGGDLTFAINDPEYGATTLAEYHNNNYHSARLFGDTQKNESALFVSGHSPIELVITDPLGRKSGYDPRTGTTLAEIPGATYGTVTFGPVDAATAEAEVEAREFHLGDPVEGTYVIEVIGTGDGAYTVHASAFRTGKSMDNREYAGSTTLNEVDRIVLQYDEVSGLNWPRLYLPYVTR